MDRINSKIFKDLYKPDKFSHKGQNGKLTIIGGSKLFHGASLWALKTASRIVDMVFYATVKENSELTKVLNSKLYDFICIPRGKVEDYIKQSDAVLIGPGMVRGDKDYSGTGESGLQTRRLTRELLERFPNKKWIIDAGALQEMDKEWLKSLDKVVVTPHAKEFVKLFSIKVSSIQHPASSKSPITNHQSPITKLVLQKAKQYKCTIVLKGQTDIICSPEKCVFNTTGNEGMTKGGTGDVLAGLIAALACKNDLFLAAQSGIFINGMAGDELYKSTGPYFNASDLCDEIPKIMRKLMEY